MKIYLRIKKMLSFDIKRNKINSYERCLIYSQSFTSLDIWFDFKYFIAAKKPKEFSIVRKSNIIIDKTTKQYKNNFRFELVEKKIINSKCEVQFAINSPNRSSNKIFKTC